MIKFVSDIFSLIQKPELLIESNLNPLLATKKLKEFQPCTDYEVERLEKDSLVLHIIKKRLEKKPPRRRIIGMNEIREIEAEVYGRE